MERIRHDEQYESFKDSRSDYQVYLDDLLYELTADLTYGKEESEAILIEELFRSIVRLILKFPFDTAHTVLTKLEQEPPYVKPLSVEETKELITRTKNLLLQEAKE